MAFGFKFVLDVVLHNKKGKGFQLLPRRGVVERTFSWLYQHRRLFKDYEVLTASGVLFIHPP